MAIQMFDNPFILTQIEWVRCPVESYEGFGWSDSHSQAEVVPHNGDKTNPLVYPVTGYHLAYGMGHLQSLVEGHVPEPGWKVVGKGPNNTWMVVPPWYVFKQPAPPPNRWALALAALAVGALVMWGGIQLLPQGNVIPTTYETK